MVRLVFCTVFTFALLAGPVLATSIAFVSGDQVHVRAGPGTDQEISDTLVEGTPVIVMQVDGDWALVRYLVAGGADTWKTGWMIARLLQVTGGSTGDGTYDNGYGATFRLTVDDADMDCWESYRGGYDSCTVEIDVRVSSNFNGANEPTVNYSCEVDLDTEDARQLPGSESEDESGTIYGRDGYDTLDVEFSFYDGKRRVSLADVTCRIDSVYE